MKAMILAAGLGTRLRPLTLERPKPLMPVGNVPLIDRTIGYLKRFGVDRIAVNAHHLSDQVSAHLDGGRPFDIAVRVYEEPEILGTGGGLKNTEDFWDDEPFILINGDILTDMDLGPAIRAHRQGGHMATLLVHDCPPFNQILMSPEGELLEIASTRGPGRVAFTGIHVLDPGLLDHIPAQGFSNIVDVYRELIRRGMPVRGHLVEEGYWHDIGTVESYLLANRHCLGTRTVLKGEGCRVHESARFQEWAVLGPEAEVGARARIGRSVLWNHARAAPGAILFDCVVTSQGKVVSARDVRAGTR